MLQTYNVINLYFVCTLNSQSQIRELTRSQNSLPLQNALQHWKWKVLCESQPKGFGKFFNPGQGKKSSESSESTAAKKEAKDTPPPPPPPSKSSSQDGWMFQIFGPK